MPSTLYRPPVEGNAAPGLVAVTGPASQSAHAARGKNRQGRHDKHKREHGHAKKKDGPAKKEWNAELKESCTEAGLTWLPKSKSCTHGPDPAPPGVDIKRRAEPVSRTQARLATTALECDDDGQSGYRVQVLYAHASDVPSRYDEYLASFRTWAAGTDTIMQDSAAEAGGSRRFRFVTTAECEIDVEEITLSPTGDDTVANTFTQLRAEGYDRRDRKYLVFVDATALCGVAGLEWDEDPGQANANNFGPHYARVDAGCWGDFVAAHELMHTLGAVHNSAPNASGAGHCIDEYDVMSYADSPTAPPIRFDCPDLEYDTRYDCGHNDYFNPQPAEDTYLATHWNTADSRFLVGGGDDSGDDGLPPVITWVSPVGNGGIFSASEGTVTLEVNATDGSAIDWVRFERWDQDSNSWVEIALKRNAPYAVTLDVSDLARGSNIIHATAMDVYRLLSEKDISIKRTGPDDDGLPPVITWVGPVSNGGTFRAFEGTVTLEVAVADASAISWVQFERYDPISNSWIEIAEKHNAPYAASLDVSDLALGFHNFVAAIARDIYGQQSEQSITIMRTSPPTLGDLAVSITSPSNGTTLKSGASVTVAGEVTDNTGATTMEFRSCPGDSCSWAEATLVGSDGSAPFRANWTAPAPGTATLLAQVTDDEESAVSGPVTVTIEKASAPDKVKKKKKKKKKH